METDTVLRCARWQNQTGTPERFKESLKEARNMASKVKDPVCGMEIDPKEAGGKSEYKGADILLL